METRKTVLLCEDDPVQLKTIVAAFEAAGYRTLTARGPGEALEAIRGQAPDAVVTDVQLEQGNGFDLVDGLRRKGLDVPVIMVSGASTEATRERARAVGVLNFLEKPFSYKDLVDRVGEIVRHPRVRLIEGRILVVEDEPVTRTLLSEILFQAGADVLVAEEGAKALQVLRTSEPPVDMVLADYHLPGLEGAALISEARKAAPGIYVAMITGEASQEEIQAGFRAGASALVRKPFSPKEVVAFVDRNLEAAREMREEARRRGLEAREPALRRFRRWALSYIRARKGSRKRKKFITACVAAAMVAVGVVAAVFVERTMSAIDYYKQKADKALDAVTEPGSRGDLELQKWYLLRKLEMDKEMNESTREYYRKQIEGGRVPGPPK